MHFDPAGAIDNDSRQPKVGNRDWLVSTSQQTIVQRLGLADVASD